MADTAVAGAIPAPRRKLRWFLAIEALCLLGFGVFLWWGNQTFALLFLLGPIQVLAWVVLLRDEFLLLLFFAALLPLVSLELLPVAYVWLVLYVGTLGLLFLLWVTRFLDSQAPFVQLARSEQMPLQILGCWVVVAAIHALFKGWSSPFLLKYSILALMVISVIWFFAVIPRSLQQVRVLVYAMAATYAVVCCLLPFLASEVVGGLLGKTLVCPYAVVNLNVFATHVSVFAAMTIGATLDTKKVLGRVVLSIVVLILLAALLFTKSRGGWLGFGIAFLYILLRTRSFGLLLLAGIAVLGLLSLDILRIGVFARVEQTGVQDPALWGRFLLWRYAWDIFKGNWLFGVGMENFQYVKHLYGFPWPRSFGMVFNTHNLFLEILVDLGVVGLASFLWLKVGTFLRLDRIARMSVSQGRGLAIGLNAGIIAYATSGLLDCVIWQDGVIVFLGVVLGLAMCLRRLETRPSVAAGWLML